MLVASFRVRTSLTLDKCSDENQPPQGVVPNISVGPNQIGIFYCTSERNFLNFWHTGEHSRFTSKLNWAVILSQAGEASGRCHTDLKCVAFLLGQRNCVVIEKSQKGILERDVFGKHVIPVKLTGELSQPLDSLRMGCGDSFF